MIRQVYGAKYYFCSDVCKDSFKEDRRLGLIYPSGMTEDGKLLSWSEFTRRYKECAYCRGEERG